LPSEQATSSPGTDLQELTVMCTRIYNDRKLRCIAGPEWDLMDEPSRSSFLEASFMITTQSDRMGTG
jgi:allophanate hydrolase subunit 2